MIRFKYVTKCGEFWAIQVETNFRLFEKVTLCEESFWGALDCAKGETSLSWKFNGEFDLSELTKLENKFDFAARKELIMYGSKEDVMRLVKNRIYKYLYDKFNELGIRTFIHGEELIPLDKVFNLDESKHNHRGLYSYGVQQFGLFEGGATVAYHDGREFKHCKTEGYLGGGYFNMTPSQDMQVYEFILNTITERELKIKENQYWIKNSKQFLETCLILAKDWLERTNSKYSVELTEGNSQVDKRVTPALLFRDCNGSQNGYIKIIQNKFGDIEFDVCAIGCCNTTIKINDPCNMGEDLEWACAWLCN